MKIQLNLQGLLCNQKRMTYKTIKRGSGYGKDPFQEYLRELEPGKAKKSHACSTAIGLQAVDGLKPSKYLIDTVIQNLEGKISMKEAQTLIDSYYEEEVDIGDAKVDIEGKKADIQDKKVDIESLISDKGSDFSVKTTVHIHRLFEKFGFDEVFGRSSVMDCIELKASGASKLLSNLLKADIIEAVSGYGKGKYIFKKQ